MSDSEDDVPLTASTARSVASTSYAAEDHEKETSQSHDDDIFSGRLIDRAGLDAPYIRVFPGRIAPRDLELIDESSARSIAAAVFNESILKKRKSMGAPPREIKNEDKSVKKRKKEESKKQTFRQVSSPSSSDSEEEKRPVQKLSIKDLLCETGRIPSISGDGSDDEFAAKLNANEKMKKKEKNDRKEREREERKKRAREERERKEREKEEKKNDTSNASRNSCVGWTDERILARFGGSDALFIRGLSSEEVERAISEGVVDDEPLTEQECPRVEKKAKDEPVEKDRNRGKDRDKEKESDAPTPPPSAKAPPDVIRKSSDTVRVDVRRAISDALFSRVKKTDDGLMFRSKECKEIAERLEAELFKSNNQNAFESGYKQWCKSFLVAVNSMSNKSFFLRVLSGAISVQKAVQLSDIEMKSARYGAALNSTPSTASTIDDVVSIDVDTENSPVACTGGGSNSLPSLPKGSTMKRIPKLPPSASNSKCPRLDSRRRRRRSQHNRPAHLPRLRCKLRYLPGKKEKQVKEEQEEAKNRERDRKVRIERKREREEAADKIWRDPSTSKASNKSSVLVASGLGTGTRTVDKSRAEAVPGPSTSSADDLSKRVISNSDFLKDVSYKLPKENRQASPDEAFLDVTAYVESRLAEDRRVLMAELRSPGALGTSFHVDMEKMVRRLAREGEDEEIEAVPSQEGGCRRQERKEDKIASSQERFLMQCDRRALMAEQERSHAKSGIDAKFLAASKALHSHVRTEIKKNAAKVARTKERKKRSMAAREAAVIDCRRRAEEYLELEASARENNAHAYDAVAWRRLNIELEEETDDEVKETAQVVVMISEGRKRNRLFHILKDGFTAPIIIFVNSRKAVRESVLTALKEDSADILVSTDIIWRGLNNVSLVVNYGMAKSIETYARRIGRTGTTGRAVTFLTPEDKDVYYDLKQCLVESPVSTCPPELVKCLAAMEKAGVRAPK